MRRLLALRLRLDPPLHPEIALAARPIELGLATGAMTIRYGCGHRVFRANGDPVHHTCPFCFSARLSRA